MDDIQKKEFENLVASSEKNETRSFQLIIYTLTAFGIIIGFKDEIKPDYLFLLILYMVLLFTTTASTRAKLNQLRINAYLVREYFSKDPKTYFHKFYKEETKPINKWWEKPLQFIKDPFILFSIIALFLTGYNMYLNICTLQETSYYIVLVAIVFFQGLIVRRVFVVYKKNMNYYEGKLANFKKNNCA
jgi:hypothetical protein